MNFFKKMFCKHKNREILRWHYTHGYNGMEPRFIEIEYKCHDCGKVFYRDIRNGMKEFEKKYADKQW